MKDLYYIENCGCDDTTVGLVSIPEEHFPAFKTFIENLNKNSNYGCMPTIDVYKINEDMIREATEEDRIDRVMYFNDKKYVLNVNTWIANMEGVEKVI